MILNSRTYLDLLGVVRKWDHRKISTFRPLRSLSEKSEVLYKAELYSVRISRPSHKLWRHLWKSPFWNWLFSVPFLCKSCLYFRWNSLIKSDIAHFEKSCKKCICFQCKRIFFGIPNVNFKHENLEYKVSFPWAPNVMHSSPFNISILTMKILTICFRTGNLYYFVCILKKTPNRKEFFYGIPFSFNFQMMRSKRHYNNLFTYTHLPFSIFI